MIWEGNNDGGLVPNHLPLRHAEQIPSSEIRDKLARHYTIPSSALH
jgi:hypothetical protein